ncbi:unnamed protein product [Coregonus sp. 'balchen']|nr:unnamed protein product [Coregonus sp. 'balchen']
MASLLGKKVLEIHGQGPPPTKYFFQLTVTKTEGAAPGENKMTHDDYLPDARLQQQVGVVFGHQILQYTQALCQGNFDYLERLPNDLLLQILHGNEGPGVTQQCQRLIGLQTGSVSGVDWRENLCAQAGP